MDDEQAVSGLERIGIWTKKIPRVTLKRCQEKGKHDVTVTVNTFSCLEPACIATFKTIEEADEHMDPGRHIMTPEKETIHDNVRRQWAAVTTSVKAAGRKIGRTDCFFGELTTEERAGLEEADSYGENIFGFSVSKWIGALKKQKAAVRISSVVKEILTNLLNKGTKDLHQKAMLADVVEQIKKTFSVSEWIGALKKQKAAVRISSVVKEILTNLLNKGAKDLHQKSMLADVVGQIKKPFSVSEWIEIQTVRGSFYRLASHQKGLPVSEEEGDGKALEKEDYMEQLVAVAEHDIGLRYPLVYDDFNFCDLSTNG